MLLKEQALKENFYAKGKFRDLTKTANGDDRAYVDLVKLETLWFNTGTRCNLECEHCYIESSPTNDELVFISLADVNTYLNEIEKLQLGTTKIAFTGGEPFINKDMLPIMHLCLYHGFEVLVLTNAYLPIDKHLEKLSALNKEFPGKITLRVSLDHYSSSIHEQERGDGTFERTLTTIKKLTDLGLNVTIAGRSLSNESRVDALQGYQQLLNDYGTGIEVLNGENIVIFPEMSPTKDVPEITTSCWNILGVHPHQQMCAHERMVVKRKGATHPVVLPCTLIAYDKDFELGITLEESFQRVYLNHPYCAQFCVLGGASCSV